MTWLEAKDRAGCRCERSDAWRCAVEKRLVGVIGCPCRCHRYIHAPDAVTEEETLP